MTSGSKVNCIFGKSFTIMIADSTLNWHVTGVVARLVFDNVALEFWSKLVQRQGNAHPIDVLYL
jgi:hypothetical protein